MKLDSHRKDENVFWVEIFAEAIYWKQGSPTLALKDPAMEHWFAFKYLKIIYGL